MKTSGGHPPPLPRPLWPGILHEVGGGPRLPPRAEEDSGRYPRGVLRALLQALPQFLQGLPRERRGRRRGGAQRGNDNDGWRPPRRVCPGGECRIARREGDLAVQAASTRRSTEGRNPPLARDGGGELRRDKGRIHFCDKEIGRRPSTPSCAASLTGYGRQLRRNPAAEGTSARGGPLPSWPGRNSRGRPRRAPAAAAFSRRRSPTALEGDAASRTRSLPSRSERANRTESATQFGRTKGRDALGPAVLRVLVVPPRRPLFAVGCVLDPVRRNEASANVENDRVDDTAGSPCGRTPRLRSRAEGTTPKLRPWRVQGGADARRVLGRAPSRRSPSASVAPGCAPARDSATNEATKLDLMPMYVLVI